MKKLLSVMLVLALCGGLMTGCGKKEPYADLDLSEYIELPDYNKFETKEPSVSVTEEDIAKKIDENLKAASTTKKVEEGTVDKGDTVVVAFDGRLKDGTKVSGMQSDGSTITLGSGQMIPGFEEGIYGAEIGKTFEINVTFPDPYDNNKDLSGQEAIFEITVLSKTETVVPELNEEFVKNNSDYKTVDEYKDAIAKSLEEEAYNKALDEIKYELYSKIVDGTKVKKYPEDKVSDEYEAVVESYKQAAKSSGVEWEDYLKDNLEMTQKEFEDEAKLYAQEIIKQEMIVYLISQKEDIEVSDEEYEQQLNSMLEASQFEDEKAFKDYTGMSLEEYAETYKLDRDMLLTKELDVIYERLIDNMNK